MYLFILLLLLLLGCGSEYVPPEVRPMLSGQRMVERTYTLYTPMAVPYGVRIDGAKWANIAAYDFILQKPILSKLVWSYRIEKPNVENLILGLDMGGESKPAPMKPCTEAGVEGDYVIGNTQKVCVAPHLSLSVHDRQEMVIWNVFGPDPMPPPQYRFRMPVGHSYMFSGDMVQIVLEIQGSQTFNILDLKLSVHEVTTLP